jgi:hypothetical protein
VRRFHRTLPYISLQQDILLVVATGFIFRYILTKNDKSTVVFDKLKQTNNDIKESNDKYDIVAKATSDTIWTGKFRKTNDLE